MSSVATEDDRPQRQRMSLDDFLGLGEEVRAEYVDGEAILMAPGSSHHNRVARRVAQAIEAGCPGLYITTESGLVTRTTRRRVPDVLAVPVVEDFLFTDQVPVLVVEVLSPSTRGEDTVRKAHEYATLGAGQYWIVDREHRSLTVYANNGDGWDVLAELDAQHPSGEIAVSEHGSVPIDLELLLAP